MTTYSDTAQKVFSKVIEKLESKIEPEIHEALKESFKEGRIHDFSYMKEVLIELVQKKKADDGN